MSAPPYDLVLYGATGFTGRQTAEYLAHHPQRASFRFAIAGRSQEKLQRLAAVLDPDGVIVADGLDGEAIDRLVDQTRVVATTAGPFAKYGDEVVRSCVERGVHYADITGETPWVRSLIDRYDEAAARNSARIVPFCGYDSVPSDLGTLWAVQQLREKTGEACVSVRAYHRGRGGINGGTVASLLHLQREGQTRQLADPFLLNPEGSRPARAAKHDDPRLPFYDSSIGGWAAPFFMGPINTRVVRRSQALLADRVAKEADPGYAAGFSYQEYWLSRGPFGLLESGTLATMQGLMGGLSATSVGANLLERMAPAPGEGPSDKTMDGGFFSCDLIATGEHGGRFHGQLKGKGDPGNRITVKCLGESALALALDEAGLPAVPGGILTPATAIGLPLVPRLERAGIEFLTL